MMLLENDFLLSLFNYEDIFKKIWTIALWGTLLVSLGRLKEIHDHNKKVDDEHRANHIIDYIGARVYSDPIEKRFPFPKGVLLEAVEIKYNKPIFLIPRFFLIQQKETEKILVCKTILGETERVELVDESLIKLAKEAIDLINK